MRQQIAYGIILVLALLAAFGFWRTMRRPKSRPGHVRVDLFSKRGR